MKIYIAGPDVFYPNSNEISKSYKEYIKNTCKDWEGIYPGDSDSESSKLIFAHNINMIRNSDIIVANLNDFRGRDVDSGTAFEIGYAYSLNKSIYGYMKDTRPLVDKIPSHYIIEDYYSKSNLKDFDNNRIENFGYPVNLMLAMPTIKIVKGTFYDCINFIYDVLK